jgi:xanthine dehydrogenase/oxidase
MEQLVDIMAVFPDAKMVGGSSEVQIEVKVRFYFSRADVRMFNGNVSILQFKAQAYPISVYVSDIPELYSVTLPTPSDHNFSFGANLPLAELEVICKSLSSSLGPELAGPLEAIRTQLRYFAGWQIRNVASVGGNIATASPISDLNPVWIAVGAKVVARSIEGSIELAMDDFFTGYRRTRLHKGAVIEKIIVPLNESEDREVVKAYKQVSTAERFRCVYS